MITMLRTLNTLLAIRTSSAANRFIYYAQKLPLIGRRIPDTVYAKLHVKKTVTIIALILNVLWGLFSKVAYTGLFVYLPAVVLNRSLPQGDQLQLFLHIFLLLSFVAAGITSASVLEPKREKYIAVKLMRLSPATYMRTSLSYRYCTYFVYYIPALLIFTSLLDASITQALALALTITFWRVFCEYMHLKLFEKTGVVLIRNNLIIWLIIGLCYTAAYTPLLLHWTPNSGSLLIGLPTVLVITALGIFAAVRLARYPDYRTAVDVATKRDDPLLDIGRMMSDAQKTSVRSKDSDYASATIQADKFKTKEGYAYLNALFFARHRSLIKQPVYKRLAIIGVVSVAGIVFAALDSQPTTLLSANLGIVLPFLVLILNFLTVGEKVCRAIFYNCDLSLLHYSFYRNAANQHFRIRLYRIIGLNLTIAAALGAALTLIVLAAGEPLNLDLLLLWVCVLVLSVFFSVHHLLMYYIFQPYSTELNVKNPFFYLVNIVVSSASGISIVVKAPALPFTIAVVIITLVYLAAALILVRRFGHRIFRVK
ncbi:hypothetical protein EHS13_32990 [Paenibacillus psychroresistens]|uniref:Uncharacterized protein n=1 Tax=Paenibacillus psychroresistens TaxID=1778678 RepID=A0A6B8RW32_9BACL|nr:hypothetical protein [Paenibacillus psychroresistens]QGQ99338.1 hypothetical protein EHS13_32990 [Paenibacillus psychroresistens]